MRKWAVSMVHHSRYGSPAARAGGQNRRPARRMTASAKHVKGTRRRVKTQSTATSQIIVEERLAVANVAVDELSRLGRDLRELRAEARRRGLPVRGVDRFAG